MSARILSGFTPRVLISVLLPMFAGAQAPPETQHAAAKKPDSPAAAAHVAKAKQTAGAEWTSEAHFLCEAPAPTDANAPVIEPTKIFDNVYTMGRASTVTYAITTADGIIMIDSGYARDVETVLLPGLKKLGLDPAKIKYAIVTHGHADHFGGAFYLQEHFGTHVQMSSEDWTTVMTAPPANGAAAVPVPTPDMILTEGQAVTLGGETVTPVFIPGHTAGSMGLIFPVKDNGKPHVAGLFGGTILVAARISDDNLQEYLRSIAHFKEKAKAMKVDVELQNHPTYDNMVEKLMQLKNRKPGAPNPFVVGPANYAKFLDVMTECIQADIARRKE